MKGKKIYLPSFYLIISIFSIFLINHLRSNSVYFMPKEYKTIKKIVDKLASKNDLGNRDIPFSIGSGRYMAWRAEELGLCKEDACWYYRNLNPYKKHKNFNGINLNELLNQSYLFSGIEAYAWNDIAWLSKSTFLAYGNRKDYLACVIAHEISHIIFNDYIYRSIKISNKIEEIEFQNKDKVVKNIIQEKDKNEELIEIFKMELNRDSEVNADINSAKIVINAGFNRNTCSEGIKFLAEKNELDAHTDKKSTHPGHIERHKLLDEFIKTYDNLSIEKNFKPYKWKWTYNRKLNTLTFKPLKIDESKL
ncbi:hypothetical protein CVS23_00185 [Prochlorococcus marinus str. XMU1401E]|nr:hypothetical protein [Prochlorococcus marinus str. XMU1401E]